MSHLLTSVCIEARHPNEEISTNSLVIQTSMLTHILVFCNPPIHYLLYVQIDK